MDLCNQNITRIMHAPISEIEDVIVDNEDGTYDDSLHQAALKGDVQNLKKLLSESTENINLKLRPFDASPLRLAASYNHTACLTLLLEFGAEVDLSDRKQQTPLFCAVKNWDTKSVLLLLEAGACPDGSLRNLSTPLHIACQNGYAPGVKLLLEYGAQTEWDMMLAGSHPLYIAVTYLHLDCFLLLLIGGANVHAAGRVLHVMCRKKCHPFFIHAWSLFGGSLTDRDMKGLLAVDLPDNPHRNILMELMSNPLSLQCICRIKVRNLLGKKRLHLLKTLDVTHVLIDFLNYTDILEVNQCLLSVESEILTSKSLPLL